MSVLTYKNLVHELNNGLLVTPESNPKPYNTIPIKHVNGASIDVRLGKVFWREDGSQSNRIVRLDQKEDLNMIKVVLDWEQEFFLYPGEFILAQTVEEFHIPNYLASEFRLKSSGARGALDQSLAVWCDPRWHNSVLTLELKNASRYHTIALRVGMKIGQMVFFQGEHVPEQHSYAARGQYNNDKEATPNKGVK